MITPTGSEDDEAEMVKESQERRSSIQVSLESEAARINQTLTFSLSDGATSRG